MKYTKDDIIAQTQELVAQLAATEEVQSFKRIEQQVQANKKVANLVAEIKNLQKQAVNLEHYEKNEALQQVRLQLAEKQAELDELPIMQDYQQSLSAVNALLTAITEAMSITITKESDCEGSV